MIARLWWKEARQVGPIWLFLAGLGMVWLGAMRWYAGARATPENLEGASIVITFVYLFLIGAAAFAGERENRTLGLLDALPVERWRVWVAKASFAAVSTLALAVLYWLVVALLAGSSQFADPGAAVGLGYALLWGLAWSLLFSALLGNALLAAALAMVSLAPLFAPWRWMGLASMSAPHARDLTPGLWLVPLGLIAASAVVLHLGGPPRAAWLGTRRRSRPEPVKAREVHINFRPLFDVWPGLTSRLVWQALREFQPVGWALAALGVVLPATWSWGQSPNDPLVWIFIALVISLVAGVNVFNAENRGGTQRFLANHGARPGVIWLVKLAVGLATVAPIWLALYALSPPPWVVRSAGLIPERWSAIGYGQTASAVALLGGFLLSAFAVGAWCGMAFRRGITAGMIALVLWLFAFLPPLFLAAVGLVWPLHLPWIPVVILAVTWAWSGDWLLDRPGLGRWARLGLYSAAGVAALSSAYVVNRVWTVPAFPTAARDRILQFDRIGRFPTPPEENAADLYRWVDANIVHPQKIEGERTDARSLFVDDWDANNPKVLAWLNENKMCLDALRKAAAMPVCRFRDLRRETVFSWMNAEPDPYWLSRPLVLSARVRLAGGDLKGAWEDIESLLRMARQFVGPNPSWGRWRGAELENNALALAMLWAADFHQTAELLESARDAYRAMPPAPSLADQLRADALIVNNTLNMPRGELAQELLNRSGRNAGLLAKLVADVMTTPWELPRGRRAYNLLAAARIQAAEAEPDRIIFTPFLWLPPNALTVGEGPGATTVPQLKLLMLTATTPLLDMADSYISNPDRVQENIAPRRALDVILSLLAWQARHDGKLPQTLDELAAADPEVAPSLIDPYSRPPARFGYVPSRGQNLRPLGSFARPQRVGDQLTSMDKTYPTRDHMLLYSVGPDGLDGHAATDRDGRDRGDIVFPLRDNSPPR